MAQGAISGRNYSEEDIFDSRLYPRMKEEPLLNDDDCLVVPVRNLNAPHFRRIGNPTFRKRLGRNENNPTHDDCVQFLLDELISPVIEKTQFSTYVFSDDGKFEEQVIFSPINDRDYLWFKEQEGRVAFCDETYIQPDLAGRDATKFFPRAAYPNVIIEVIRTHHPDEGTFRKLFELSKTNHHIYFYFVAEGKSRSKLNHIRTEDEKITIRVSHYLIGGVLFKNGDEFHPQRDNETFEQWYHYLKNSYFTNAKEKA